MDLLHLLMAGGILFCCYHVWQLRKENETGYEQKQKEEKQRKEQQLHERLREAKGKQVDLSLKEPLTFLDTGFHLTGMIKDVDEDWILIISRKGNKDIQRYFRCNLIDDIMERSEI